MGYLLYDRLHARECKELREDAFCPGRWRLPAPSGEDFLFMNSIRIQSDAFICADSAGRWGVARKDSVLAHGITPRFLLIEDNEAKSLRQMEKKLRSASERAATWNDWLEFSPLPFEEMQSLLETFSQGSLETTVLQEAGYLESVCMNPKAHLKAEIEKLPVSRARRLSKGAIPYLAGHTEDWERLEVRGVRPKRLLCEVLDDQLDIYENRVTVRLIDHLVAYVAKLEQNLVGLCRLYDDKANYSEAVNGTYYRRDRISTLWGENLAGDEGSIIAEEKLKKVRILKRRLMGLMDSPLYREIPGTAHVAPTLKSTNIFVNDPDYRRVASLWRKWSAYRLTEAKNSSKFFEENQEICAGMNSFGMLLVLRSLGILGYVPLEESLGITVEVSKKWILRKEDSDVEKITCEWLNDGSISLDAGREKLVLLSLPVDFRRASSDEDVKGFIKDAREASSERGATLAILYIGCDSSSAAQRLDGPPASADGGEQLQEGLSISLRRYLHSVGNDPRTGYPGNVAFLPVSPWDLASLERVSRLLRFFLDSGRFMAYPMIIPLEKGIEEFLDLEKQTRWLRKNSENELLLIKPPSDLQEGQVKESIARIEREADSALLEYEQLKERSPKEKNGALYQKSKAAHRRHDDFERRRAAAKEFEEQLRIACVMTKMLLRCPVCGTDNPDELFEERDRGCFRCECLECNTRWENRVCSEGHRFAVLLPGGRFINSEDTGVGWEDRIYGSDLLSLPAQHPNGEWGILCPECGKITGSERGV